MPNTTYGTPYAQSSDLVSNWPGVSSNVADRIDDVSFKGNGLNDQTGTSYTLVLTDAGKTVTLNNAAAVTVTIPTNASVAYETGTVIQFTNKGAGVVTISPAGGVTLNNSVTLAQNASASIQKLDTNTWVMIGAQAPGLTLITSSTFSAVSSVSVNDCFSANYDTYELIMTFTAASANTNAQIRMRAAGIDNTSANYLWHNRSSGVGQTALAFASSAAAGDTSALIGSLRNDFPDGTLISVRLANPFATARTLATIQSTLNDTNVGNQRAFLNNFVVSLEVTTSYDGFTLSPVTGTFSGTVRVYGYRNS